MYIVYISYAATATAVTPIGGTTMGNDTLLSQREMFIIIGAGGGLLLMTVAAVCVCIVCICCRLRKRKKYRYTYTVDSL